MICACIDNLLDLYMDGRLAPFQARWVARHLKACPACAAKAAAWERLSRELRALPAPPPPAALAGLIRAAVASAAAEEESVLELPGELFPARTPSMALAFGLLALILSISGSLLGPGVTSQVCADGTQQACLMDNDGGVGR